MKLVPRMNFKLYEKGRGRRPTLQIHRGRLVNSPKKITTCKVCKKMTKSHHTASCMEFCAEE